MCDSTSSWLQQYSQPFTKQYNVQCHSGHVHQNNMPAVGFVLVRLNESSQLELLLDLRSNTVEHPNTWGFIGGNLNCVNEEPLDAAYREAREEYGINAHDLNILGLQFKRDHGGVKHLTYTYIFAGYNGQAPAPLTSESVQSQWFNLDALPDNLMTYIKEDLEALQYTLRTEIYSMLLEARGINTCHSAPCNPAPCNPAPCNPAPCHPTPCHPAPSNPQACKAQVQLPSPSGSEQDADGDISMSDADSGYSSTSSHVTVEQSIPAHSLGFCEPVGSSSYYFNMANNDLTMLTGQVSYPNLDAALQALDSGKFTGLNSLTAKQRSQLMAQAKAAASKPKESKDAAKQPQKATSSKPKESKDAAKQQATGSVFSRFSQFLRYLGPKSKPATAAKPPTKVDASTQTNGSGKRVRVVDASQQTGENDEPSSKKAKTEATQSGLMPKVTQPTMPAAPAVTLPVTPAAPAPQSISNTMVVPPPAPQPVVMPTAPAVLPPPPMGNNGPVYTTTHAPLWVNNKGPVHSGPPHPNPVSAGFSGTMAVPPPPPPPMTGSATPYAPPLVNSGGPVFATAPHPTPSSVGFSGMPPANPNSTNPLWGLS
ncbi:hypothetical protein F5B21DRAFT_290329 [Xylaria acuta]|nr:hypothetical protein F5B21DRAFT_290329 [Xylaria acuta]